MKKTAFQNALIFAALTAQCKCGGQLQGEESETPAAYMLKLRLVCPKCGSVSRPASIGKYDPIGRYMDAIKAMAGTMQEGRTK